MDQRSPSLPLGIKVIGAAFAGTIAANFAISSLNNVHKGAGFILGGATLAALLGRFAILVIKEIRLSRTGRR